MKIAVWHNLPSGGGKRALYDQIRGLVSRGHEIQAWCPPTADRSYLPLSDIVQEHVVPLRMRSYIDSPRGLMQNLHPIYWSARSRLRDMNRHCRECARQMNAGGFDLLFSASCIFFNTPLIGRYVTVPSIIYLQEPHRSYYEAAPELPWTAMSWTLKDLLDRSFWRKALLRRIKLPGIRIRAREERLNAMAFDRILVNSLYSRESVLRALGVDSRVCYLGVDTARFVNQSKKREKFVICVAAFLSNKNIELPIQALAKIAAPHRPKFIVVSNMVSEVYLKQMRQLADQSGVNFEVKYRIEDAELVDLLNRARMMLYAPRLEPFGLAPLEANACGLPVIAVAEGGVRESIQDGINGLLVEHDPESMAHAIERLLNDNELHGRISVRARELVQSKWSLERSIDALESMLKAELSRLGTQRTSRLEENYFVAQR